MTPTSIASSASSRHAGRGYLFRAVGLRGGLPVAAHSAATSTPPSQRPIGLLELGLNVRAFAWFLGMIVLAGVIGAVIAYPAYELTSTFAGGRFIASRPHRHAGAVWSWCGCAGT